MEAKGIVAGESALAWWRHLRMVCSGPLDRHVYLKDRTKSARLLLARHAKPRIDAGHPVPSGCCCPISLIACGDEARLKNGSAVTSRCSLLPDRSVVECEEGFFVLSPEMCFVHMAGRLSIVDTVLLGFELCGTYVACPGLSACYGRSPICSKASLLEFARRAKGVPGRRRAMRALSYVLDGSASPMETIFAMMLCLPYRMGGFGLPEPELNYGIRVQKAFPKPRQTRVRYADLCWPDLHLICEYDSDEFHPEERRGYDAMRRNDLRLSGYTVVEVGKDSVCRYDRFVALARTLAGALGKRLRLPADFDCRHVHLRVCLFGRKRNPLLL